MPGIHYFTSTGRVGEGGGRGGGSFRRLECTRAGTHSVRARERAQEPQSSRSRIVCEWKTDSKFLPLFCPYVSAKAGFPVEHHRAREMYTYSACTRAGTNRFETSFSGGARASGRTGVERTERHDARRSVTERSQMDLCSRPGA